MVIHQMEVVTAFRNGRLDEDIYMRQPEDEDIYMRQLEDEDIYMRQLMFPQIHVFT